MNERIQHPLLRRITIVHPALFLGVLCVLLIGTAVGWLWYFEQKVQAENLRVDIALLVERNESMEARIAEAEQMIASGQEQLELHKQLLSAARYEAHAAGASVAQLNEAVASVSSTATYLTKLKETDEELLAKYSKVYFLNEHYVPRQLVSLSALYTHGKEMQFHGQAISFLEHLLHAAQEAEVDMAVASAYRSFSYQSQLKDTYTHTYGSGANTFSADQGYSEHQLGTAIDFTTSTLGGALVGFENTPAYAWLMAHAHEYGFTLSYPKNNAYYMFEPWHWRFVGVALATHMHNNQIYFYDMPQRDIDTYRVHIFDTL